MRKYLFVLGVALFFASCGEKKKEEIKKEVETTVEPTEVKVKTAADYADDIALGEKLFTEKTCATCHNPDMKVIGPSIKNINKIYTEKGGYIIEFLKGETPAIVDTDPGQVAIMKANLDGFVKNLTNDELAALSAYIRSVK